MIITGILVLAIVQKIDPQKKLFKYTTATDATTTLMIITGINLRAIWVIRSLDEYPRPFIMPRLCLCRLTSDAEMIDKITPTIPEIRKSAMKVKVLVVSPMGTS